MLTWTSIVGAACSVFGVTAVDLTAPLVRSAPRTDAAREARRVVMWLGCRQAVMSGPDVARRMGRRGSVSANVLDFDFAIARDAQARTAVELVWSEADHGLSRQTIWRAFATAWLKSVDSANDHWFEARPQRGTQAERIEAYLPLLPRERSESFTAFAETGDWLLAVEGIPTVSETNLAAATVMARLVAPMWGKTATARKPRPKVATVTDAELRAWAWADGWKPQRNDMGFLRRLYWSEKARDQKTSLAIANRRPHAHGSGGARQMVEGQ